MRDGAGGPAPQAEHPVVDGEPRPLVEAHDAQRRRDRPPARGENDTRDQDQNVAPDCGGEEAAKGCIHTASTSGTLVGMAQTSAWVRCPGDQPLRAEVVDDGRELADARADRRPPLALSRAISCSRTPAYPDQRLDPRSRHKTCILELGGYVYSDF